MRRTFPIFVALTKNWLRSRSGLFFSFAFPLMLLLIFGTVFGSSTSGYQLFVQNLDLDGEGKPSQLSQALVAVLNKTGARVEKVPADLDAWDYARGKSGFTGTARVLIIPKVFEQKSLEAAARMRITISYVTAKEFLEKSGGLLNESIRSNIDAGLEGLNTVLQSIPGSETSVRLLFTPGDSGARAVEGVVRSTVQGFNLGLIGAQEAIRLQAEERAARTFRAVDYYLPGYIAAFIMTNGIIGVTTNSSEFRRRGIIKRLATTPLSKVEWILGTVLSQTLLNFMLLGAMITFGWVVFGVTAIPDFLSLFLIFVGSVSFSGIGMLLSGLVKDVEAASAAANAIAFPMMFLSGSFWPLEIMPAFMQDIAKALPLFYFSDGLRNTLIYANIGPAIFDTTLLIVLGIVFISLGAYFTRWKER